MNSRYFKWLKSGLLGTLALLGLNACSDDHFDISPSTAKESLWTQIASNPGLDSLKQILERTTFTLDEYSPTSEVLTYDKLLQSAQTFTVWAPKDGTYNAQYWLDMLNTEGGNRQVEKQFVRNHIARYNFSGVNGGDTIRVTMLNSKVNEYNLIDNTFKDVAIEGATQPASNGSLHVLSGEAAFDPNLYEVIEVTGGLDSLYNFLHEDDTLMFDQGASTPGATVDGEVQYVDSVFHISNTIIGSLNSWQNEDSIMLGVLPSNEAWEEALAKVSKYFNYKESYPYRNDGSTQILYNSFNVDSMRDVRMKNVILSNVITSLGQQPTYDETQSSLEYFKNWISSTDSLVRGGYASLDNPNIYQPYLSQIFDGGEPMEVSNGFAYIVNNYNYLPSKSWHTTIRVEAESTYWQNVNGFASAAKENRESLYYGQSVYLTSLNRNDSVKGYVSNNSFRYFPGSSSASQPTVSFKIPNIQSGKYDIYVVMVPLNMNLPNQPDSVTKRNRFEATLTYDYNDRTGRDITQAAVNELDGSGYFETRAGVVDTILLFRDFEFPYAFQGAEPSYPMIELKSVIRTAQQRADFDPALYIDCFLFVGKDD